MLRQTLLNMLPTLDVWWRRFHQYFGVLLAFANSGEGPRQYLLSRGLAAQLIDFVLQDESPHPELNNVPAYTCACAPATRGFWQAPALLMCHVWSPQSVRCALSHL